MEKFEIDKTEDSFEESRLHQDVSMDSIVSQSFSDILVMFENAIYYVKSTCNLYDTFENNSICKKYNDSKADVKVDVQTSDEEDEIHDCLETANEGGKVVEDLALRKPLKEGECSLSKKIPMTIKDDLSGNSSSFNSIVFGSTEDISLEYTEDINLYEKNENIELNENDEGYSSKKNSSRVSASSYTTSAENRIQSRALPEIPTQEDLSYEIVGDMPHIYEEIKYVVNLNFTNDDIEAGNKFSKMVISNVHKNYDGILKQNKEKYQKLQNLKSSLFVPIYSVNDNCNKNMYAMKIKIKRDLVLLMDDFLQKELLYTEKLRFIVKSYIPKLLKHDLFVMKRLTIDDIFCNIEDIARFHEKYIVVELIQRNDISNLTNIFIKNEQSLRMYIFYTMNYYRAYRICGNNAFFQNESGMGINCYILEPVKRLLQYKLFFHNLYENCKKLIDIRKCINNSNYNCQFEITIAVKSALKVIEGIIDECSYSTVVSSISHSIVNLSKQGRLLRHDLFTVQDHFKKSKKMRCFLFENCVIFTLIDSTEKGSERFSYFDCILMTQLGISQLKGKKKHKFTISMKKPFSKSFNLMANKSICEKWTSDITKLLSLLDSTILLQRTISINSAMYSASITNITVNTENCSRLSNNSESKTKIKSKKNRNSSTRNRFGCCCF